MLSVREITCPCDESEGDYMPCVESEGDYNYAHVKNLREINIFPWDKCEGNYMPT